MWPYIHVIGMVFGTGVTGEGALRTLFMLTVTSCALRIDVPSIQIALLLCLTIKIRPLSMYGLNKMAGLQVFFIRREIETCVSISLLEFS